MPVNNRSLKNVADDAQKEYDELATVRKTYRVSYGNCPVYQADSPMPDIEVEDTFASIAWKIYRTEYQLSGPNHHNNTNDHFGGVELDFPFEGRQYGLLFSWDDEYPGWKQLFVKAFQRVCCDGQIIKVHSFDIPQSLWDIQTPGAYDNALVGGL